MIIKKPFAFIVKHYKFIHLLLLIPLLYLTYKSYNLMTFFKDYVINGYLTKETNIANIYYNLLIPISSLLIMAINTLIYSLLKTKNKPSGIYLFFIIFYFLFFIVSLFLPGILQSFETTNIDSAIALMFRGISNLVFYIQPLIIIIFILKGFGFDLKTFQFNDIKDEISLDESDSEEIELNVGVEDYKFKRGIRRYLRELKYYIIENKIFFSIISGIIGIILLFFIGKWVISLNRVVSINKTFNHSNFSVTFNDSVLSTLDYNGASISQGKIYLAVKTTVKNNTKSLLTLDTDAFWLELNNQYYYPVLDRSGKFIDLAKPYYGEKIGAGVSQEYVLVYELDDTNILTKYKIKILDSLTYKENEIIPSYKEITLKPTYSSTVSDVASYSLGDSISLANTTLLNSNILINSFEVNNVCKYNYQYCYNNACQDSINSVSASANDTLLILNGSIQLDENSSYYKYKLSNNNFAQDFIKIEYTVGSSTKQASVKDVTPSSVTDKVILETSSGIKNANTMKLLITIRNQRYTLVLK